MLERAAIDAIIHRLGELRHAARSEDLRSA